MWRSIFVSAGLLAIAYPAGAKPIGPSLFCEQYPAAPACLAGLPACTLCHAGSPPARNVYGMAIEAALAVDQPRPLSDAVYAEHLPAALLAVESLDSDGDGFANVDELAAGTLPGDDHSLPDENTCAPPLCGYDPKFVFKKINLDFCGRSPTLEDTVQFAEESDPRDALSRRLNSCLDSAFWLGKNGQLWKLAHRKIRPLLAIKSGEDAENSALQIVDYYDDYALYTWTQIDNHDVREVLTADYFVSRSGDHYTRGGPTGEQRVAPERRAGMLTTRWNLLYHVMFSALPRTAAAQAYRAYLGVDIARLEGLFPVANEPVDYDAKGVAAQETCRNCHSTLDPLAYPFRNYNGFTGDEATYEEARIEKYFAGEAPQITAMPEAGYIFGQPVKNLVEWASIAADSDAFASATVMDYWRLLIGHAPRASERAEFEQLWRDLKGKHRYGVERMLHALIETEAYGVP